MNLNAIEGISALVTADSVKIGTFTSSTLQVNTDWVSMSDTINSNLLIVLGTMPAGSSVVANLKVASDSAGTGSVTTKTITITPPATAVPSGNGILSFVYTKADLVSGVPSSLPSKFLRLEVTATGISGTNTLSYTIVHANMQQLYPAYNVPGSAQGGRV